VKPKRVRKKKAAATEAEEPEGAADAAAAAGDDDDGNVWGPFGAEGESEEAVEEEPDVTALQVGAVWWLHWWFNHMVESNHVCYIVGVGGSEDVAVPAGAAATAQDRHTNHVVHASAAAAAAAQECTDVAEPAPEVLLPLLPFQKQFLAWGLKQVGRCCCWRCCCLYQQHCL
jgi:hypothetical protein